MPKHLHAQPYTGKPPRVLPVIVLVFGVILISLLASMKTAHADGARTLTDAFGITRTQVITWLESHEHDDYYQGTPYRSGDWRSPNGDINGWGASSNGWSAGMNCTGFVWHALCAAHNWDDDVANRIPALQGWVEVIRNEGLLIYRYDSKEDMLADGKLEKGDIIWMFDKSSGGMNSISNYHHVGIFWGNSPHDDRLWHSVSDDASGWEGSNRITEIYAKAAHVLYVVVKTEPEVQQGHIDLLKASANPSITDGNDCYRIEGATYDIFNDERIWVGALTTNTDGWAKSDLLDTGWYMVKEKTASKGYALDTTEYWVEVVADHTVRVNGDADGSVAEQPFNDPASMWVRKVDHDTAEGIPEGSASLAGAEFRVDYYDGYYSTTDKGWIDGTAPTRSWLVKTDSNGYSALKDEYKVSGDPLYYDHTGTVVIPLGTITVQETKAPSGYMISDTDVYIQQVTWNSSLNSVAAYNTPVIKEQVIRGGVSIAKLDHETMLNSPLGGATVDGAVFNIVSKNPNPVVVDGVKYSDGQTVKTIVTANGRAATDGTTLPYGTYEIHEAASPAGYLVTDKTQIFSIQKNGVVVDLIGDAAISNQVIRGDLEFIKVEAGTLDRMASIPFEIRSNTTGESHVVVTDENGYYSTSSAWNPHSHNTNLGTSGSDGTWFGLASDGSLAPVNDDLGALPYDTYTITELPCEGNEGKALIAFEVAITRNAVTVDLGTITNEFEHTIELTKIDAIGNEKLSGAHLTLTRLSDGTVVDSWVSGNEAHLISGAEAGTYELTETIAPDGYLTAQDSVLFTVYASQPLTQASIANGPIPEIGTQARDADSGTQYTIARDKAQIVDTVAYKKLIPGKPYTLCGTLMDKATGTMLEINGEAITASVEFIPAEPDGIIQVEFLFDASDLSGISVVAFEYLYQEGNEIASHTDIADEGQTVEIVEPRIETQALDAGSGTQNMIASDEARVIDMVRYTNLVPGRTYSLEGTLMDKATGTPLIVNDEEVHTQKSFTPETASGSTEVEFLFDARTLTGTSIVVFESLYDGGYLIAAHADIADENQTLSVLEPKLTTKAVDKETGTQNLIAAKRATIIDAVSYENLAKGKDYILQGTLMDRASGEPLFVNGRHVTSVVEFSPEEAEGTIGIEFDFEADSLAGTSIVVFETLYLDGIEMVAHADIDDADQTVGISTTVAPKSGDYLGILFGMILAVASAIGIIGVGVHIARHVKERDRPRMQLRS